MCNSTGGFFMAKIIQFKSMFNGTYTRPGIRHVFTQDVPKTDVRPMTTAIVLLPATPRQKRYLKILGIPFSPTITKQQAKEKISEANASRRPELATVTPS